MQGFVEETRACLLAERELDRAAYLALLRYECGVDALVGTDFSPTSIWSVVRDGARLFLIDCDMPDSTVIDAVQMIPRLAPDARLVVLSATAGSEQMRAWSRCALHGYVLKTGGVVELRSAVAAQRKGECFFSEGIESLLQQRARPAGTVELSRRERELLPLLANGLTLREAAQRMSVSYKTADAYRTSLFRKLGLRDRVELARYAIRTGIIEA